MVLSPHAFVYILLEVFYPGFFFFGFLYPIKANINITLMQYFSLKCFLEPIVKGKSHKMVFSQDIWKNLTGLHRALSCNPMYNS